MLDSINIKYWELSANNEYPLGIHKGDSYSKKCDICGDSKHSNKKRLVLYRKSSYDNDSIKCFNCGYTGTMFSYLRNHHPDLYSTYKKELLRTSMSILQDSQPLIISETLKRDDLVYFDITDQLVPIQESQEGLRYIQNRNVSPSGIYFSYGIINVLGKQINLTNYVIIPLTKNDKWFGFYSRCIDKKIFHTYIPEQNTGFKIWNYFNITKYKTVYAFESIFNAKSSGLTNVIAMLGSDMDYDKYKDIDDIVFVYDNDATGREKSIEKIKKGRKVLVWDNKYNVKDINELSTELKLTETEIRDYILNNIYSGIIAEMKIKLRRQ